MTPNEKAAPSRQAMARQHADTQDSSTIEEALRCAGRGWSVLPIHAIVDGRCTCRRGQQCSTPGKHPRTKHGVRDATRDPQTIRQWFERWPASNYGIATGAQSGIIVLDVDPRNGGDHSLEAIEAEHGPLPETVEALTGGGGRHSFFQHPGGRVRNQSGMLGAGLDVKGDGGYVVGPGSIHASGETYEWELSSHPDETPIADAPEWLVSRIRRASDTERDGENGEDGDIASVCSAHSVLSALSVTEIITRTLPEYEGQRNRKIMDLARHFKAIPHLTDRPLAELRSIVERWHRRAYPAIGTKPVEDTWADFCYAWKRVKYPAGTGPIVELLRRADAAPLPAVGRLYEAPDTHRLLKLCRELQRKAGKSPFYLSCATAGELLGIDRMTAHRRLQAFLSDGVLELVELGRQGRASRYRYVAEDQAESEASENDLTDGQA